MKREHSFAVALAVVLSVAGLLVWGFLAGRSEGTGEDEGEATVKPAVQVSQNPFGPPTLVLSPELQRQAGIEVSEPQAVPYRSEVQAYGSVLELQSFTELGNTLASASAERAIAAAKVGASRAAHERAQLLYRNNQNFSKAQLQAAEAAFQMDEANFRAADIKAQNAKSSADQAWGPVLGQALAANTALAQDLIRHKRVLVQVTMPLGMAPPHAHESATVETPAGERAPVEFISAAIRTDPRIQGASFFYSADAASGLLPGMNVIARLSTSRPMPGIVIPASAVVWVQGRAWVYLRTGENAFTRHEISTAQPNSSGGYLEPAAANTGASGAVQGLPKNEPLVISGAQSLLSQEFSALIDVESD